MVCGVVFYPVSLGWNFLLTQEKGSEEEQELRKKCEASDGYRRIIKGKGGRREGAGNEKCNGFKDISKTGVTQVHSRIIIPPILFVHCRL